MSEPAETTETEVPDQTVEPDPAAEPPAEEHPEHEPVQPSEAAREVEGKVIALPTATGVLSIRPGQANLDTKQKAALVAIGIDTRNDPGVEPQIRPFMHMCQIRGLDPFAREAYLIGRGKGDNRKYTMQVAIDGYRKIANGTGRFLRVKDVLWTGKDDDQSSWRAMDDGDGGVVMRRVWFDQWPESRGWPGAAKVVIEHLDAAGGITTTSAVADWSMYAPMTQAWHWGERKGQKVMETNDDGTPKMVLSDMWSKGPAHMLAKCAEALAYRKAFPASMSGMYVHEEMHRHDQIERERTERSRRDRLVAAHVQATSGQDTAPPVHVSDVAAEVVQDLAEGEPVDAEPVIAADSPEGKVALTEEIAWQAEVLGTPIARLVQRQVMAVRRNFEDFTGEDLLAAARPIRQHVVAALRDAGRVEEADRYAALAGDDVVLLAQVHGQPTEPDEDAEVAPEDDPRLDADPEQPHEYVNDGGACAVCSRFEDEPIHTV